MTLTFADLGVPADLVGVLTRGAITEPFPIQAAALPDALAGRDVSGRAPTGSGKTLAFGIATIARLDRVQAKSRRPLALILTPTRELCAQIAAELSPLATARGRRVASFYGGVGYETQIRALRRGVDVAVACPGRLADLINRGHVCLDEVSVVVVDEADRMADMGFLPEVRRILDRTPDSRQTLLFSATLDGDVDVLVRRYQRNSVRHELEMDERSSAQAQHLFWRVDASDRIGLTAAISGCGQTVVFCRTKHGADRLTKQLGTRGVRATAIHGDRSQGQRERALADFTAGRVRVLVATDVAARGIHVEGVAAVVHFDPPADGKDYVHRSGRTARAGASGTVVCFVTPDKAKMVRAMQKDLGMPVEVIQPDMAALDMGRSRPASAHPVPARPAAARAARPATSDRRSLTPGQRRHVHASQPPRPRMRPRRRAS
jgi:superfamily II DNA/RNA helicase